MNNLEPSLRSLIMQWLKERRPYSINWKLRHWSRWWGRPGAIHSILWHDWQEWSWRDSYQSRQWEQDTCERMWRGRMLLTQHSLHWSDSDSIGQSYQCLLILRAVYQVWVFIIQGYWELDKDGGCHVIVLTWRTGEEHHLAVVSAHAEWTTRVQTPNMAVTVMLMTTYGVKTAVFSLTRQSFQ